MANGYLSSEEVFTLIRTHLPNDLTFTVNGIKDFIVGVQDLLIESATVDIKTVAQNIVRADVESTTNHTLADFHKIACIKALRDKTGMGLRECKDAVNAAYVVVMQERAEQALYNLSYANDSVMFPNMRYISAVDHRSVLCELQSACDVVPF